ncbi:MAG: hypothetical protein IKJ08_08740, partial [Alistipes sp.]|nr:hypothetical protein [Alistipes sp.]
KAAPFLRKETTETVGTTEITEKFIIILMILCFAVVSFVSVVSVVSKKLPMPHDPNFLSEGCRYNARQKSRRWAVLEVLLIVGTFC